MATWNDSVEEQFINMIEEKPALYNITDKSYSNRNVKADIWHEIESKLQISEKELRRRWDSLRTQYTRYHKLPSSGGAGAQRTTRQLWILNRLQFLEPHTKRKETLSQLNEQETPAVDQNSPSESGNPEDTSFDQSPEPLLESTVCEQEQIERVTIDFPGLPCPDFSSNQLLETLPTAVWNDSIEEQFINMIEEKPALYNNTDISYSNRNVKADIWHEIESKLQISEKELRKKWDSLRTQYTRYQKLPSSGGAGAQRTTRQLWILTRLQFLEPHTKRRETLSHLNGQESPTVDQSSPSECTSDATSSSKDASTLSESPEDTSFDPPPEPLTESTVCEQAPIEEVLSDCPVLTCSDFGPNELLETRPTMIWNDRVEEQFINMIEERPALYNSTVKSYSNRNVKADIWHEIESKLQISEKELRKRWDSLRTQYTRYQKLPSSGRTTRQLWILTRLQFLEPHTKRRESRSKFNGQSSPSECTSDAASSDREEDRTQSPEDTSLDPPEPLTQSTVCKQAPISRSVSGLRRAVAKRRRTEVPMSTASTDLMATIKKVLDRSSQETEDPLDLYFKYLKSSVRGLPDHLQHELLHEMDNLLYKYKSLQRSQVDPQVTPM